MSCASSLPLIFSRAGRMDITAFIELIPITQCILCSYGWFNSAKHCHRHRIRHYAGHGVPAPGKGELSPNCGACRSIGHRVGICSRGAKLDGFKPSSLNTGSDEGGAERDLDQLKWEPRGSERIRTCAPRWKRLLANPHGSSYRAL